LYIIKESRMAASYDLTMADVPVYPTHTSLTDNINAIGEVPFRFVIFRMPCGAQLCTLADGFTKIQRVY